MVKNNVFVHAHTRCNCYETVLCVIKVRMYVHIHGSIVYKICGEEIYNFNVNVIY